MSQEIQDAEAVVKILGAEEAVNQGFSPTIKIAPTVQIDGKTYAPPGWMWVLGFALGGCDWAILEADKPEFKERMRAWLTDQRKADVEQEIAKYEARIAELKKELHLGSSTV